MSRPLIIIGNGGHASVLTEILMDRTEKIIGFTAPLQEKNRYGLPYLGSDEVIENYLPSECMLVLGIGMIEPSPLREKLFNYYFNIGYQFMTVIHPSAIIAPSVRLGQGVQVMAGAIIQTNTKIADNSIINTGAIIDHDCQISSHTHISPGTRLSGGVHIKKGTHIGVGATVIQNITIGENCLIGAGAVVINNIADNLKVIGVPAKEV
ncbi:MAG: acetyltransferase [Candidatus Pristimantibacillus lignocellulolyticus]|uniref:Acetyltransferase n=1 Tax=Candidatus Pristimantibacillus lignocellulolyticus TaxID=2994561 RepID=A0A9J6ZJD7_9BACL|nr:MAG: acetyltransferase [Candidatus Pristimantibacillus lignocellulolyticus]